MGYTKASIKKPSVRPGVRKESAQNEVRLDQAERISKALRTASNAMRLQGKESAQNKFRLDQAERISKLLRTASNPTRLHILLLLSDGERDVQALATELRQNQLAISHHLALLNHTNLVASRRERARNFHTLTGAGQELAHLLEGLISPGIATRRLPKVRSATETVPRKDVGETVDNARLRFSPSDMASWEAQNRRRLDLVDKEFEKGLTAAEETELRLLQEKADAYVDVVAPLPFGILDKLRECAKKDGLDVSFLDEE